MAGMTKESIQLKNVKIAWHMSEETTAFTATLYINGKKAAHVKNDGTGGDNHPWFLDRELGKEFYEFCKNLPYPGESFNMTYDSFIGILLDEWISNDDWKKACKKGVVYTLTSHKDGEYMLWKVPYSPEMAKRVREQYSETGNLKEIINERFI
jgi:hypothetical protein